MANKEKDAKKTSSRSGGAGKTSAKKKSTSKPDVKYDTYEGKAHRKGKKSKDSSVKYFVISTVLIAISVFMVACYAFPDKCGAVGPIIHDFVFGTLASGAILVPILLFSEALFLSRDAKNGKVWFHPVFSAVCVIMLTALLHAAFSLTTPELDVLVSDINAEKIGVFFELGKEFRCGGVLGGLLGTLIVSAVGGIGTIILAVLLIIFCSIFVFGFTPAELVRTAVRKYNEHKEKSSIKKDKRAQAAVAAQEKRREDLDIALKKEELRQAELEKEEREKRKREEEEKRELERMRQSAKAHNESAKINRERANEIRREIARSKKAVRGDETDEFDTDETPRARKHGDIDDIFSADFIDGGETKKKKKAAPLPEEPVYDEDEDDEGDEDKEFRGSSVAAFWNTNDPDSETTFEELPEFTPAKKQGGEDGETDVLEITDELDITEELEVYEADEHTFEDGGELADAPAYEGVLAEVTDD